MKSLQKIIESLGEFITQEASNKLSFWKPLTYAKLFEGKLPKLGKIKVNHPNFPLPSLQFLTADTAENQIHLIVNAYSQKSFWGKLWWRIVKTESIDEYLRLYNVISARNLKKDFEYVVSTIHTSAIEIKTIRLVSNSLLDILTHYLCSYLPNHGFINRFFQEHFMQELLESWSTIERDHSKDSNYSAASPPSNSKKNTPISNDIITTKNQLKSGEMFFAANIEKEAISTWINEMQTRINTIKSNGIPEKKKDLTKIVRKFEGYASILLNIIESTDEPPLIESKLIQSINNQFNHLKIKLKQIEYGCSVHIINEMGLNNKEFPTSTYLMELNKKGGFKRVWYYGKNTRNPQIIPLCNIPDLSKIPANSFDLQTKLENCLFAYHNTHAEASETHNPINKMRDFFKLSPERIAGELIYSYSLRKAKEITKEDNTQSADALSKMIMGYRKYVIERYNDFMHHYNASEKRITIQKNLYEEAKKYISNALPKFQKKALALVINATDRTEYSIKKQLLSLLKLELLDGLDKDFNALSPVTKKQLRHEAKTWCNVLKQVCCREPSSLDSFMGFFTTPTSPWNEMIKEAFLGFQSDLPITNYQEALDSTAIVLMQAIMDEKPEYSNDLRLAFEEIMVQKHQCRQSPRLPLRTPILPPVITKHADALQKSVDEKYPMPLTDTESAWNLWLFKAMKNPKTLEKALDAMAEYIQKPTENAETDLLRFATLTQLALHWVEAIKWKKISFKITTEAAAEKAIKIVQTTWKKTFAMQYHPDKHPGVDQETKDKITENMQAFSEEKNIGCKLIREAVVSNERPDWIRDDYQGDLWEQFMKEHNDFMDYLHQLSTEMNKQYKKMEEDSIKFSQQAAEKEVFLRQELDRLNSNCDLLFRNSSKMDVCRGIILAHMTESERKSIEEPIETNSEQNPFETESVIESFTI